MKLLSVVFLLSVFFTSCNSKTEKINGISFVSSSNQALEKHIKPVQKLNANYAAVMPFGFIGDLQDSDLQYNDSRQWFGERVDGVSQYIDELHKSNIKVMLKPQIWVMRGEFTGNIMMTSDDDWKQFEKRYTGFMTTFAKLAQEKQVGVFCIGTELEQFIKHRPDYWKQLIVEMRKIYRGKLTYAANWDEYTKTSFWQQLDYIGIDGYFPLSKEKTPTIDALKQGWERHKVTMKKYSDSISRKVLFTEFGYRSIDYTAKKPWLVDYNKASVNLEGQAIATEVLFAELWKENWFAGGFVWKWFMEHEKVGGLKDNRFTPQNKPAEDVIRKHYLRHR